MSDSSHVSPSDLAAYYDVPELAFTPVPVRARHDGWTPTRQRDFIVVLSQHGCVIEAARAVGKSSTAAYKLRGRPDAASFAAAWDKAIQWGTEVSIDTAIARAVHGEVRPYYYRGEKRGETVRHDNRLVLAVLERERRHEEGGARIAKGGPRRRKRSDDPWLY